MISNNFQFNRFLKPEINSKDKSFQTEMNGFERVGLDNKFDKFTEKGEFYCLFLENPEDYSEEEIIYNSTDLDPEILLKNKREGKKPYIFHVDGDEVHCPEELKKPFKRFGINLKDSQGNVTHMRPGEFNIVAWTPEQLRRINQAVENVFERLKKNEEEEHKKADLLEKTPLVDREIIFHKGKNPLFPKEKFPDLKKLKEESSRKRRLSAEFREEEFLKETSRVREIKRKKREAEKDLRESKYLKSEEHKWENKQKSLKFETSKDE